MRSLWDRVRKAHVVFVTTGYLRLMEPIAEVLIKLGISANALTTIGTLSTVGGGVAFAFGHMRIAGWIIGLTAIADALDGVVARKTGQVTDVSVLSGHPLLNEAAIDAVRQWQYRPMLLNGQPIDVVTTVTVNFSIQ